MCCERNIAAQKLRKFLKNFNYCCINCSAVIFPGAHVPMHYHPQIAEKKPPFIMPWNRCNNSMGINDLWVGCVECGHRLGAITIMYCGKILQAVICDVKKVRIDSIAEIDEEELDR